MAANIAPQCDKCNTVTKKVKERRPKKKSWKLFVLYRCPKCKLYRLEDETY